MFPYFEILGLTIYMTGIGIIVFLISFIIVAYYLSKKWHQDFYKLFYWLPIGILLVYVMGSYFQFVLDFGFVPQNIQQLMTIFSPYGYKFHYVGLLLGFIFALYLFFRKISRYENKRVWADIIFFSLILSLIPLGIFLMFGDNFIGKPNSSWISLKPLTTQSELNKFGSVYPLGIFLSILSIIVVILTLFIKRKTQQFGQGIIGFILLLVGFNIIMTFQQYPKYGVTNILGQTFDIKNYISFFVIMFCFHVYYKRKNDKKTSV